MPPSQIPSHTSLVANRVYSCLPKFVGSEECFATQVWRDVMHESLLPQWHFAAFVVYLHSANLAIHFFHYHSTLNLFFLKFYLVSFGGTGSLLVYCLFSSCREPGLVSGWGVWASSCGGFSCCRAGALGWVDSVIVIPRLWSTGSIVVAAQLTCPVVCGIFLDQGLNPCLLH